MIETLVSNNPARKTLVVGGGIIGLLTARELVQAGATVTLVEMGETGRESSWAGGGIISPLYPWRYADSVTALARWSQHAYPTLCADLHQETGVDPELTQSGLLILDLEERDRALAWAERHQVDIHVLDAEHIRAGEPELGPRPAEALLLPTVAQVRNPRLARAARRSLEGLVELREQEEVLELLVDHGRARGVRTAKGEILAEQVVVCTGAWTAKLLEQHGSRPQIEPVRGQMILFLARPGQITHVTLYRDRYVIPRRDGHVLIGSTLEHAGFAKATTAEAKEDLYRSAVELFPILKRTPIEDHWSGLRPGSPSGIPYIGAYPDVEGLYLNAGHFRNGVVTGPASARLVAELILGRAPILDPAPYALVARR
jgi:glycine oxidase